MCASPSLRQRNCNQHTEWPARSIARAALDELRERTQAEVNKNDEVETKRGVRWKPRASSQHADGCRAPQRRRRVEAVHAEPFLENQAGAEKADAGDDLCRDTRRDCRRRERAQKNNERSRAQRDQRVGPEALPALAPLPLETYRGTEHDRCGQMRKSWTRIMVSSFCAAAGAYQRR